MLASVRTLQDGRTQEKSKAAGVPMIAQDIPATDPGLAATSKTKQGNSDGGLDSD